MPKTTLLREERRKPTSEEAQWALMLSDRLPRLALEARRVSAFVNGVHGRRRPGPGESFWQYRMLTPGEPAAGIDWRRSGRDNRVYIREREWEASHTIWLWIDRSASMGFHSSLAQAPKVDRAIVVGLALADALVDAGERVGLHGLTRPYASRRVVEQLIEHLAADEAGLVADLPAEKAIGRLDEAILISDWLTPAEKIIRRLHAIAVQGGRGHLVMMVDPVEESFPFVGQAELRDPEGGLRLDVGDAAAWGHDYRIRIADHRAALQAACQKLGWTFTIHHTDRAASEIALKIAALVASARDMRSA